MMMEPMRLCRQRRVRQHLERTSLNDNGRHERLKSRQVEICRKEPKVLQEIVKGAQLGTKECQHQFRNRRWNCTTARKSLRKVIARGKKTNKTFHSKSGQDTWNDFWFDIAKSRYPLNYQTSLPCFSHPPLKAFGWLSYSFSNPPTHSPNIKWKGKWRFLRIADQRLRLEKSV